MSRVCHCRSDAPRPWKLGAPHGTGHGITGQMAESSRACIRRPRAVSKEVVDGGMGGLLNCFSAANMVRARINGVPFVPDAPVRLHPDQKGGGGTKIRLYGTPEPRPSGLGFNMYQYLP